jgi:hypothetical protein
MERFLAAVPDAPIVLMLGLLIALVGLLVFLRRGGLAAGDARIDAEMAAEGRERAGHSIGEAGWSPVER